VFALTEGIVTFWVKDRVPVRFSRRTTNTTIGGGYAPARSTYLKAMIQVNRRPRRQRNWKSCMGSEGSWRNDYYVRECGGNPMRIEKLTNQDLYEERTDSLEAAASDPENNYAKRREEQCMEEIIRRMQEASRRPLARQEV
jgi:hypothetical protein